MTAYLPNIFTTYNNRGATPIHYRSPEVLSHKAFRASFTLAALGYIAARLLETIPIKKAPPAYGSEIEG